jgi:hypothetical protein
LAKAWAALVVALLVALSGCGGSGVAEGATVTVYAEARACPEAKRALAAAGTEVGSVKVSLICTLDAMESGRLDLATVGAGARRAVEDSRTVAYIEEPGRANRFSRPILEEPQIALVVDRSGAHGMARILDALRSRGSSESPRESVWASYSRSARASSMSVKRNS